VINITDRSSAELLPERLGKLSCHSHDLVDEREAPASHNSKIFGRLLEIQRVRAFCKLRFEPTVQQRFVHGRADGGPYFAFPGAWRSASFFEGLVVSPPP
jgi:hypothetical protein